MSASVPSSASTCCEFCRSTGYLLYTSQQDRLFGAPGLWNFRRCSNQKCGLTWLDPVPSPEDLLKAYENYYTHSPRSIKTHGGGLTRFYKYAKAGYVAHKYGYKTSSLAKCVGMFIYLLPFRRNDIDAEMRYLEFVPRGRLLDVGCGSGEWLKSMCDLGWQCEGTDFDAAAVAVARKNALQVHCGSLNTLKFPANTFDAITMNHVIEHVPDPIGLVRECLRILKPGGRLILATPNINSFGHQVFKQNWRGLEPPRHLQVMSPVSLFDCLRAAGFAPVQLRTHNSSYVHVHSHLLARGGTQMSRVKGSRPSLLFPAVLALMEQLLLLFKRDIGECISASAVKPLASAV